MAFTMRTTKPGAGNKYYIRKAQGGYSNAIAGNPTDSDCDVLANCVGYAYGRFNEIGGYGCCKYLAPVNAENFIQYKGSCKTGMTPKLGACMVWRKGATLSNSDGAGHVAIVEKVVSATEVITSESGWGSSPPFWTRTRKEGDGNWGAGSGYTFLGFIYNPAVDDDTPVESTTSSSTSSASSLKEFIKDVQRVTGSTVDGIAGPETLGNTVTVSSKINYKHMVVPIIQKRLYALGYTEIGKADGVAGPKFTSAVAHFQQDNGCFVDGEITKKNKTWKKLLGM